MLLVGDAEGWRNQYGSLSPCFSRGSRTLQQREGCPVSKEHYQKSKASEGLKEGM